MGEAEKRQTNLMNISKQQLKIQFDRAKKLGWLPFFTDAANEITGGFFDAADLLAIASRETNLDPKWLTRIGDNGNGFGLMQADRRSFPEFTRGDGWKDAKTGIIFGAKVLMQKLADTQNCFGLPVTVKSSKGGFFAFKGKSLTGADLQKVVLSAYNCGRWAHYAVSTGRFFDKYSTAGDYGTDVMSRADVFRAWLLESEVLTPPEVSPIPQITTSPDTVSPVITSAPVAVADENSKLKDFSDKYLRHCQGDSAKNIALVFVVRIGAAISALWTVGITGKIFLILICAVIVFSAGYVVYFYSSRFWGWFQTIFDSLASSPN